MAGGAHHRSPGLAKSNIFPAISCIIFLTNNERSLYYLTMPTETQSEKTMTCETCKVDCQRFGKHRNGLRRFRCPQCKRTYTESHTRTLGMMYVSQDKAALAVQLLLEGNSIRSTERITKLDRNTIMRVLVLAGEGLVKTSLPILNQKFSRELCRGDRPGASNSTSGSTVTS